MKKFLAIVLCMLLAFSTAVMAGCNQGDVYDGDYSQVPASQAESFAQQVEDANKDEEFFDFTKGFSIKLEMDTETSEGDAKIDMEMLTSTADDKNQLYASIEMESEMEKMSSKVDMKTWYKDGYAFIKAELPNPLGKDKIQVKGKEESDFDEELSQMMVYLNVINDLDLSILGILDEYAEVEGLKIYIDNGKDFKKCKIVFPKVNEENETMEMSMVLVYDANYKLYALKYEMESTSTFSDGDVQIFQKTDIDLEIKPTTKAVSYPKDIDKADAWNDDLSVLEGLM